MSDLPTPASQGNYPISQLSNNPIPNIGGGMQKEVEIGGLASADLGLVDAGMQEMELPKEVASAGVAVLPTTVQFSTGVQNLGVRTVGQAAPAGQATTIVLPLTDDQIAQGLHQGITSSFRWLAEWCIRRLKQVHIGLKFIHGKLFRITYA